MSLPGASRAGNGQSRNSNDKTDNDAPEHEANPRRQHNQIDAYKK
jgi:hypothetical protein